MSADSASPRLRTRSSRLSMVGTPAARFGAGFLAAGFFLAPCVGFFSATTEYVIAVACPFG